MIQQYDFLILDFIREHMRCAPLDAVMSTVTHAADAGILWIALAIILLCTKKYRRVGCMMGLALIFGLLVGNLTLEPIIARIRPYDINTAVDLLIAKPTDYSFPSGHTLASFEAATVLMLNDRRMGIPAMILAIVIAFSRLYLYVHYPTDVFAGIVLGLLFGVLATAIVRKLALKKEKTGS